MAFIIPKIRSANRSHSIQGFTLVELMVASLITTTALLGIYSTFRQALVVEQQSRRYWDGQRAAEAVTDHLAQALQNCLNLPEIPALTGSANQMVCFTESGQQAGQQYDRYFWDSAGESEGQLTLYRQTMRYAGSKNLMLAAGDEELSEEQMWLSVPVQVIATRIDEIRLQYRDLSQANASWQDQWQGPVGKVAIKIIVRCQEQLSQRIVVPRVNASAL